MIDYWPSFKGTPMKILALEKEIPYTTSEQFAPHLKAEAAHIWELYKNGQLREIYFRGDRSEAVLILECTDVEEAHQVLDTLPLVKAGLIRFEVIPLVPYPGFERLFGE
jgi:muconolactone delta-isomerase